MYANIFGKKGDDYTRYWISVSTEKYDSKKKKGTGEYINASIPARLFDDIKGLFDDSAEKTKTKNIRMMRCKGVEGFFEAVEPREGDPFVRFVVTDAKVIEPEDD